MSTGMAFVNFKQSFEILGTILDVISGFIKSFKEDILRLPSRTIYFLVTSSITTIILSPAVKPPNSLMDLAKGKSSSYSIK